MTETTTESRTGTLSRRLRSLATSALLLAMFVPGAFHRRVEAQKAAGGGTEEVLRLNNLGIAEMEQFHFTQAAAHFKSAEDLDRGFLPAAVNLGLALFYDRKNSEAERVLRGVLQKTPRQPEALFVLALLQRSSGKDEEALRLMNSVLEIDPGDAPALYFAGSLESALHRWDGAIRRFRAALARDPVNVSIYYALAKVLVQKGETAEAEKVMAQFQEWKARGTGTSFGNQYGEQGRYAQAVRISSPGEPPDKGGLSPRPRFADVTAAAAIQFVHGGPRQGNLNPGSDTQPALYGSGAAFLDFDGDGYPDLFLANASGEGTAGGQLYRNNQDGTFRPVADSGIDFQGMGMGVAAGDYDNDGKPDLFIAGRSGSALYHNEGQRRFSNATGLFTKKLQEAWALSAAFADVDHDGDLDLVVTCAGGSPNLLFRNNGDGTFTEAGEAAGVAKSGFTPSIALLDYNDSRDIDLLLVNSRLKLMTNNRDGSFQDAARSAGLDAPAGFLGLAAGDFDGDGRMDVAIPGSQGAPARIFWNTGGGYESKRLEAGSGSRFLSVRAFDYDNDGDLDLLLIGDELRLLENKGRRDFVDVTAEVGLGKADARGSRSVAIADYDRDGDPDLLVTRCGNSPLLLRNDGGNRNHAFRLSLEGKSDNRFGLGTKVEWAAGGLWQHLETDGSLGYLTQSSTDLLLGLGKRTAPDFVRVLWPTGVLQSEIPQRKDRELHLPELDRKGTSCPILYAWNGTAYEFVSDFLGGSAMGYLEEPGRYGIPDTDEYVKIAGGQLVPRGNRLSLKMANQLEEVILFDMVRLLAVDHPSSREIYPNERLMSAPPFPDFKVHTVSGARPVASAHDGRGADWTGALALVDRTYVRGFKLLPYKGYAEEHALELELGDLQNAGRVLLLMNGWIDYATSSSNFAAAQAGLKLVPPYLQVAEHGRWRTVLEDMGFPAGLPKTITVDLTGKVPPSKQTRIRIVTNMRIYWDQVRVETAPEDASIRITTLQPAAATASWLGYPMQSSPDAMAPFGYQFDRREAAAPWKTHRGEYTRLGDVLDLLRRVDDRYVVLSHGEVITAEFAASGLPPLPEGWTRDWLLHVDGFGKDMDLHSQYPDTLEPLPRHGSLPYNAPYWQLPAEPEWNAFRRQQLTRRP